MNIQLKITTQENATELNLPLNTIVNIDLEEYVATVVMSEIGTSNIEAAKAQAIAARTYAIYQGVLDGKVITDSAATAQAYRVKRYKSGLYPICLQAAYETEGQILTYKGEVVNAVYCDSNGGRTYSAKEIWGGDKKYLIAVPDAWTAASGKRKNGHGVGMSQAGCKEAAKQGIKYSDILAFYYPGTEITSMYDIEKYAIKKVRDLIVAAIEEI